MKPFNLEEYLANPSRKIVTRKGKDARIICTDRRDLYLPIVALVAEGTREGENVRYYTKDGQFYVTCSSDLDLFFAAEKHEGWVNVYMNCNEHNLGAFHSSKEDALKVAKANDNYVATVKIEWEE